jgi:hypothetical protein
MRSRQLPAARAITESLKFMDGRVRNPDQLVYYLNEGDLAQIRSQFRAFPTSRLIAKTNGERAKSRQDNVYYIQCSISSSSGEHLAYDVRFDSFNDVFVVRVDMALEHGMWKVKDVRLFLVT